MHVRQGCMRECAWRVLLQQLGGVSWEFWLVSPINLACRSDSKDSTGITYVVGGLYVVVSFAFCGTCSMCWCSPRAYYHQWVSLVLGAFALLPACICSATGAKSCSKPPSDKALQGKLVWELFLLASLRVALAVVSILLSMHGLVLG